MGYGDAFYSIHAREDYDQAMEVSADKLVMIDFYAVWCGPCKLISPKVENLWNQNDKYKNNIALYKCDVDELEDLAMEMEVSAMPTFFFFWQGEKVDQFIGAKIDELRKMMERWCP